MGRRVHHLLTVGAGYKEGIESQIHNWLILKSWDILDGRHSTARSWKRNKENENSRDLNSVPRIGLEKRFLLLYHREHSMTQRPPLIISF